jgi:hypothetical protein
MTTTPELLQQAIDAVRFNDYKLEELIAKERPDSNPRVQHLETLILLQAMIELYLQDY